MTDNADGGENEQASEIKNRRGKKSDKSASGSAKPVNQKRKSFLRSWRSTSPVRKIEIIVLACTALAGLGYLGVTIWGNLQTRSNFRAEYRPLVVLMRPPELVGQFACKVTAASIHLYTGPMHIWVKNIGKAPAVGAFVEMTQLKLVPEKKIGDPFFDDVPSITDQTCSQKVSPKAKMFPVNSGQEVEVNIAQAAGVVSLIKTNSLTATFGAPPVEPKTPAGVPPSPRAPIAADAVFQLYAPVCVYYFGEDGTEYGSCLTYRLALEQPTEQFDDYGFSCTQSPVRGAFQQALFGFCEN